MQIERLEIERFGGLEEVTIAGLGRGVQVLHGTNEIGKTSLLEFVRAIFFGFEGLFRRGVLDPQRPCSGRLVVAIGRGPRGDRDRHRFLIERRHEGPGIAGLTRASYEDGIVGIGGDEGDVITIERLDDHRDAEQKIYLQDLVGDIDEATFTNVMAFGLDELHELRTLEPEGCGSRLYELANGLDRSRVAATLRHIEAAIARLEGGEADNEEPPLDALERERRELSDAIDTGAAATVGDLFIEQARLRRETDELAAAVERARHAEDLIRAAVPVGELHQTWQGLAGELESLKIVTLVHPDYDGWRQDGKRRRRAARVAETRRRERRTLARELADLPAETVVWEKRTAINALADERPRLERLVADAGRAETQARLAARRFGEQVGLCGLAKIVQADSGEADDDRLGGLLPEGLSLSFGPLQSRARRCKAAARAVAKARRRVTRAKKRLEHAEGRVQSAEATLGGLTLTAAIEAATEQATAARKRIAAGQRVEELQETTGQLEREMGRQVEGQVLPMNWLLGLGGVFVVGAGMLLSGLLLPAVATGPLAYAIAALGLAGTGVASVMTWTLDKSAGTRLDELRRQHDLARKQQAEAAAHCEALDRTIAQAARQLAVAKLDEPSRRGQPGDLERRAAQADAEIARLEQLAGREDTLPVFTERLEAARQALKRAVGRRKAAVARWRKSLEQRGLPAALSPAEVWRIGTHRHELLALDDDRRRLSDEARQKREELAAAARRIDATMVECNLVPEGGPLEQLQQLIDLLDEQQRAHDQRQAVGRKLDRARLRHRQAVRQLRACDRSLQAWLDRWEADSEEAFLEQVDRRPAFERLERDVAVAERTWLDARARFAEPELLDDWLDRQSNLPLPQRLADAEAATAELEASRAASRHRLEQLAERIALAEADDDIEPKQRQLARVEADIADHRRRLELLRRSHELLETTRAEVARHHQPAALQEASHWLKQLTEGRYTRITTAVDEARLDVHDAEGTVWNPERLSRGTREQVFLALRLALVRGLHEHGIVLPVVMDDALVNFDDRRARAAAKTLVAFMADQAGDRQMLVLTCHAHVAALFQEAAATVRFLGPTPPRLAGPRPAPAAASPPDRRSRKPWPAEEYFFGPRRPAGS